MFRLDPGPCPICDAPHCGCTPGGAVDSVVILGQRDALVARDAAAPIAATAHPVEPAAELQHPHHDAVEPVIDDGDPEPFTTANYTRAKHGPKRPRRAATR